MESKRPIFTVGDLITSGEWEIDSEEFLRVTVSRSEPEEETKEFEIPLNQIVEFGQRIYSFAEYLNRKEYYCVTAIRNLAKKTNSLELFQGLIQQQITEEDFREEMSKNANKYLLRLDKTIEPNDFPIIAEITQKIGFDIKDFTISDIAELFSIEIDQLTEKNISYFSETL